MNIAGIHAIVTGAAGGIGSAICRMLLDAGAAQVGALDIKPVPPCEDSRLVPIRADIRDIAHVQEAVALFPNLQVLIHAAAVLHDGALAAASFRGLKKYPEDLWDTTLDTNLKGAFLMAREALPSIMRAKTGGVIINISSISRAGRAGQAAYAASKGGIVSFSTTLAQELAPYRIRAVAIAPGLVDTPMAMTIPETHRNDMLARVPAGRLGQPQEIAHAARFCIENDFFNGRVLEVDGGAY
jgi:3-oxoacyl-[acyl-carrier protein] reductase